MNELNIEQAINAAVMHQRAGELAQAEELYRRALAQQPLIPEGHFNLGTLLDRTGRWAAAVAEFAEAVRLRPDWALAHWNLGFALLRQGDYARGWREYEWRAQVPELGVGRVQCRQPRWDGSPLNGRRILLYAEQGLGDTIQFSRYVPLVAGRGGKVALICHAELVSLLANLPGVERCEAHSERTRADFDVHCPLPSLPGVMGTTAASIPARVPYLTADAGKARYWGERLAGETRRKIGLAWAGRRTHWDDHHRSMAFGQMAKLAEAGNARFISLQKGEAGPVGSVGGITDWTQELKDFSDTAGLAANLDLVISVDTSVAHLAGAMGKPVWLLLPFAPDWRWGLERSDSAWYPTMRLFRQKREGDWQSPLEEAAGAMKSLA
jgi:tetratricopeptide (TPR) repeat protein